VPKPLTHTSDSIIQGQLTDYLQQIENVMKADGLMFSGQLYYGHDDVIRDAIESIPDRKKTLIFIIETTGGFIEVAHRIVDTIRKHYPRVEFVIPNFAMSAGTVLVMSGDAIHMDYYSVLGPIDPQIEQAGGRLVPATGYLIQYERLIKKSKKGTLSSAELAFLIEKFDPAELYQYEQARELSVTLLKDWLVKYKFKNWSQTETRKKKVTSQMKTQRAGQVARELSKTDRWHSHGRGISMEVLKRVVKLQIEDFEQNTSLHSAVRSYYKLLLDYMRRTGLSGVVHARGSFTPLRGQG
jgi:hypothetical protein